jgi:hypothetical protein
MANLNAPFGFKAIQTDSGSVFPKLTKYYISAGDSSGNIYVGDPVMLDGGADVNGIPSITRATAGSNGYSVGVVHSVDILSLTDTKYRTNSTARYIYVLDDPDTEFEIQADEGIVAADISNTVNFSFGDGGSVITGFSGAVLDSSNIGTGTQLKILRVSQKIDNEIGQNYCVAVVRFALHEKRRTTGV